MPLQMGHCDREGVGGVWARDDGQPQHDADHLRDLGLVGAAAAGDRSLHPCGCVFERREAGARADEERNTTRVTELRRGLRVFREEQRFDAGLVGAMLFDDADEASLDLDETIAEVALPLDIENAVRDVREARSVFPYDAPSEVTCPRIEAEDDHASFAISSSETSKSA
jgi:hypothetical protein